MSKDTAPGEHECQHCKRVTRWVEGARGIQRCVECGDRFPCRSQRCGHVDCNAARGPHAGAQS